MKRMFMNFFIHAYQTLIFFGSMLASPLLLICRIYWGILFMKAGYTKLADISHLSNYLESMNFIYPHFQAYLAAAIEFFGGLCLVLGFASRLVAIPLVIVMLTAYSTAHVDAVKVFFGDPSQFVSQAPFNYLLTCLLVLAFGPGLFSIDYFLETKYFSEEMPTTIPD